MDSATPADNTTITSERTLLDYDHYCAEIVTQTDLLRSDIESADLTTPVLTCPDWNLGQLLRHLGGAHRWVETVARTRATERPSTKQVRDVSGYTDEDPAVLDPWLAEGAAQVADSLRTAGPDAEMWTLLPEMTPLFWARHMTHETLIHRADAALALGAEFTVEEEVALDAIQAWMDLGSLPQIFNVYPERRELLGPGRTLHFHATDTAPDAAAEWLIDLTGDTIRSSTDVRMSKVAVTMRGRLTDLLLVIYRRRPAHRENVEILGDVQLLDFLLERVRY